MFILNCMKRGNHKILLFFVVFQRLLKMPKYALLDYSTNSTASLVVLARARF